MITASYFWPELAKAAALSHPQLVAQGSAIGQQFAAIVKQTSVPHVDDKQLKALGEKASSLLKAVSEREHHQAFWYGMVSSYLHATHPNFGTLKTSIPENRLSGMMSSLLNHHRGFMVSDRAPPTHIIDRTEVTHPEKHDALRAGAGVKGVPASMSPSVFIANDNGAHVRPTPAAGAEAAKPVAAKAAPLAGKKGADGDKSASVGAEANHRALQAFVNSGMLKPRDGVDINTADGKPTMAKNTVQPATTNPARLEASREDFRRTLPPLDRTLKALAAGSQFSSKPNERMSTATYKGHLNALTAHLALDLETKPRTGKLKTEVLHDRLVEWSTHAFAGVLSEDQAHKFVGAVMADKNVMGALKLPKSLVHSDGTIHRNAIRAMIASSGSEGAKAEDHFAYTYDRGPGGRLISHDGRGAFGVDKKAIGKINPNDIVLRGKDGEPVSLHEADEEDMEAHFHYVNAITRTETAGGVASLALSLDGKSKVPDLHNYPSWQKGADSRPWLNAASGAASKVRGHLADAIGSAASEYGLGNSDRALKAREEFTHRMTLGVIGLISSLILGVTF